MSEEQKSFPVRYMPLMAYEDGWAVYEIMDTLHDDVAAKCYSLDNAHKIAKLLNEAEGYVYKP